MKHSSKKITILFLMVVFSLVLSGCMPDKDPLIKMKFSSNESAAELYVEEIQEDGIVYLDFDPHKKDVSSEDESFIAYEELFQTDGGTPLYTLHLYLQYELHQEEFNVPEEFDTQFRQDAEYREYVGTLLNKPFGGSFRRLLE